MKIIIIFLLLITSFTLLPQEVNELSHMQQSKINFTRLTNDDFYQMVNIESIKRVNQLKFLLTKDELKGLEKIRQHTFDFIKSKNPLKHFKHLFLQYGLGVTLSTVISEIVTVIILPPILVSMGMPTLAIISAAGPSPAISTALYIHFAKKWQKNKLIKDLGLSNYDEMEKLRIALIGHTRESKILSITLHHLNENYEVTIIKRKFEQFRSKLKGGNISFNEIYEIAKNYPQNSKQSKLNARKLELIKRIAGDNSHLHTTLLINHIGKSPEAENQLAKLVKDRYESASLNINPDTKNELVKIDDKIMAINKLKDKIQKNKKEMIYRSNKNSLIDQGNLKSIKSFYDDLLLELNLLDVEIKRYEYSILSSLLDGQEINIHKLSESRKSILAQFRLLDKKRQDFNTKLDNMFRSSSEHKLKVGIYSIIDKIKRRFATPKLFNSCRDLIYNFLF